MKIVMDIKFRRIGRSLAVMFSFLVFGFYCGYWVLKTTTTPEPQTPKTGFIRVDAFTRGYPGGAAGMMNDNTRLQMENSDLEAERSRREVEELGELPEKTTPVPKTPDTRGPGKGFRNNGAYRSRGTTPPTIPPSGWSNTGANNDTGIKNNGWPL
jgi:hypothetical protein